MVEEVINVISEVPIHDITDIRERMLHEIDQARKSFDMDASQKNRTVSSLIKETEHKVAAVFRKWYADLIDPTVRNLVDDVKAKGFNPSDPAHMSLVAMVAATCGKDYKEMLNGVRVSAEMSGVLKEKPSGAKTLSPEKIQEALENAIARVSG